jgi:hypothetical protein
MNTLVKTLLISTFLASPALAEMPDFENMSKQERRAAMEQMSPEQKAKFHEARKAEWESLSDAEKLKKIEERRSTYKEKRDEEWNKMSDAEKIAHAEKKMDGMKKGPHSDKGHKGKKEKAE